MISMVRFNTAKLHFGKPDPGEVWDYGYEDDRIKEEAKKRGGDPAHLIRATVNSDRFLGFSEELISDLEASGHSGLASEARKANEERDARNRHKLNPFR